MSQIDLSIVIVNYKTPKLLEDCLASVYKFTTGLTFEVIVVDNDSHDDSKTRTLSSFPLVKWIAMSQNSGFARANNAAIKLASGEFLLLLNSDTVLLENSNQKSIDYFRALEKNNISVGFVACKMKDLNDDVLFNSNLGYPEIRNYKQANSFYIRLHRGTAKTLNPGRDERKEIHSRDHEADWIGLAYAICRLKTIHEFGFFLDEDFFMYYEDVELCKRMNNEGFRHFFYAGTEIIHINAGSSTFSEWRFGQIKISEWLYMMKVHGNFYFLRCMLQILLNNALDAIFYIKQKLNNTVTDKANEAKKRRKLELRLVRRFFFTILLKYRRKTSSAKTFLKYTL